MIDQTGLVSVIDKLITQDQKQRSVSCGTLVKALILNGLGFTQRRLYLCSSFFEDKPIDLLLGADIKADHINDDALGRCLDKLYDYGLSELFSTLSATAVKSLGLSLSSLHQDTTSFHLDGHYNSDAPRDETTILITRGYSRDHRPELNQVILNLICASGSGIPVHMQAVSGNQNDQKTLQETIKAHLANLQNDYDFDYYVADSALYNGESLQALATQRWITRVPERIKEAQECKASAKTSSFEPIDDNYSYITKTSGYAGMAQRWLIIHSKQAALRETKSIEKRVQKQVQTALKTFKALARERFACQADAQKAAKTFAKNHPCLELTKLEIATFERYQKAGKPKAADKPVLSYGLKAQVNPCQEYLQKQLEQAGIFILATNELDTKKLSDQEILLTYKAQQTSVEKGFRFLKDPQFMASTLFVKKPQRVEAILFVMTLCLMVYAALEWRIRQVLVLSGSSLPDQKGKPTQKPTARWTFALFKGIHTLEVENKILILNLKDYHLSIIRLMGDKYQYYYKLN